MTTYNIEKATLVSEPGVLRSCLRHNLMIDK